MKTFFRRFYYAFSGLFYAVKSDRSFRSQIYGVGALVALVLAISQPLAAWELLFLLQSYFLILITELQNSAFEKALDRLHPERHDNIGQSKDMAAAAVLTASAYLAIVLVVILGLRMM